MYYRIICSYQKYDFSELTDTFIEEFSELEETDFFEIVRDIVLDVLNEVEPVPVYFLSEREVWECVISKAERMIYERADDYIVISQIIDENHTVVEEKEFSFIPLLLKYLSSIKGDYLSCAPVCAFSEQSMNLFIADSSWHAGYISVDGPTIDIFDSRNDASYKDSFSNELNVQNLESMGFSPAIWFGLDSDAPKSPWIIKAETCIEDIERLMELNSDYINEYPGYSDAFGIWYGAECGCVLPDLDEIFENCPVNTEETLKDILKEEIATVADSYLRRNEHGG